MSSEAGVPIMPMQACIVKGFCYYVHRSLLSGFTKPNYKLLYESVRAFPSRII